MTQQLKDLVLSPMWLTFDPWPKNVHMLQTQPEEKKKKKRKKKRVYGWSLYYSCNYSLN